MPLEIKTIILGGFSANCYLLKTSKGFVLIDTGRASGLTKLEKELEVTGCRPGNLDLIILTHGDFDHTGNAAYLREKYGAKIAMNQYDSGMVEYGDMFWNRKTGNVIIKKMINALFKVAKFKPDFSIDEKFDLSKYGLDAEVLYLPGHSKGSIGILTSGGDFFCGDLFINRKKPEPNSIVDDLQELNASIDKVKGLKINIVYPGHGKPFQMSSLK
jgi:glyoxylase-like metal-dependent hydrolase (beta-lactamase superfamily II)